MKYSIIDIGSNSIRLTLYETEGRNFKILFREKMMAGLAGYVEDGILTTEGIACACYGLMTFKHMLDSLELPKPNVFATASLRNISNTESAINEIRSVTGLDIEVLSGRDEALLGYAGAMRELNISDGAFVDIGGASTEIVTFKDRKPVESMSFGVGSLSLYRNCVKHILPGKGSQKRIDEAIHNAIDDTGLMPIRKHARLIGVGGTARAVMKIAQKVFGLSDSCCHISRDQVYELCERLCRCDKEASDLILKLEADRIHTLIPGLMILQHIFRSFDADELIVSRYGVREGYLWQKLMKNDQ